MNLRSFFTARKPVCHWCAMCLFLLINTNAFAQSIKSPENLKQQISQASGDTEKAELLLQLSNYYLTKTGEAKADLDSAYISNNKANQLSKSDNYKLGQGKSMLLQAQILREKGNREKAKEITKNTLVFSQQNNFPILEGDCYLELCAYLGNERDEMQQKIKYHEIALPLYKKGNATKKTADVLKNLGDFYGNSGDSKKALKVLNEALVIYKKLNFKELQGIYTIMSANYGNLANSQLSLKYALMAEKTAADVNDNSYQLCTIYNHLALAYFDIRKYNLAKINFEKAFNLALENKNAQDINLIGFNLASLNYQLEDFKASLRILKLTTKDYPPTDSNSKLWRTFMFLVTYSKLGELEKAKPYYESLLKEYELNSDFDSNFRYKLVGIIIYLQQSGQSEKSFFYLNHFKKFAEKSNKLTLFSQYELLAFKSNQASKKYEAAIKHLQQHQIYRDSIFNLERQKQASALQLEFETAKKDENIKALTHQGKLQEIQIHNDSIIRYVFIGSVLILILFLGLLYNGFRLKKRSNEKLELKRKQIDEQNDQLKKLLTEKEWLLKEIHHRVKNNLQIVISLLNTQSAYLENEDALMAIQNSQHRMHAMSLIHQKLYQSNNLASIDMSWYIYELINYMKECFGTEKKIHFILNTEEVHLDVAQAVPLGLIINEAINNTIKYAFPSERKGQVVVSLKNLKENKYQLLISDDGIGLPENFNIDETDSLGMNLMRGLSDQLDGTFDLKNENGLKIEITFTKNIEFEASADTSKML